MIRTGRYCVGAVALIAAYGVVMLPGQRQTRRAVHRGSSERRDAPSMTPTARAATVRTSLGATTLRNWRAQRSWAGGANARRAI